MVTTMSRLIRNLPTGQILVLIGILLFLGSMVGSAVTAPGIGDTESDRTEKTLVGSQGGGPGWHKYGSVYLLEGNEIVWRESSADSYFDVTKTANGTVLAGFLNNGYSACGPYDSPCARTGFREITARPNPKVRSEYSFPVRSQKNSEVHDVERLSTGEYLLTDMEYERIFTVQNGTVTWQWNASDFYDAPPDPTKTDWLHINDVDVISDDRYLVSVRNANQLVVVQRGKGVIQVINQDRTNTNDESCRQRGQLKDYNGDGDIRCGDPTVLDHQHNPQWLGPNAILVADSENDRVVELHQREGKWTPAWSLARAGGVTLQWPRDADRLPNGNTLITDTLNRRIVEVNASGEVVWSYQTSRIPYEADRLPAGETVGGQTYNMTQEVKRGDDVPLLSTLLVGFRAVYPDLPYWYREMQLLLTILSLISVSGGLVMIYRNKSRAKP